MAFHEITHGKRIKAMKKVKKFFPLEFEQSVEAGAASCPDQDVCSKYINTVIDCKSCHNYIVVFDSYL